MKFIIALFMLALLVPGIAKADCNCTGDAMKAQESFSGLAPATTMGLMSALALAEVGHQLVWDKHIDRGWYFLIPVSFVTYEFGKGLYYSGRVGIKLSRGI